MDSYSYINGQLYCEDVPIAAIASAVGTPFYLYSARAIERSYQAFEEALCDIPHLTCFAVKANSNLAVLNLLRQLGSGFDIVSQGELYRLQEIGTDPQRILFSGVGKTDEEILAALEAGILEFNAESEDEVARINRLAGSREAAAHVALRVNPDVDTNTHAYVSTGRQEHKFGIPVDVALKIYTRAQAYRHLVFTGVSCHIGSQITELQPFQEAVRVLKSLILKLGNNAKTLKFLDVGGGLGIRYAQEHPPSIPEYVRELARAMQPLDLTLMLEPGRSIVAKAGVLVTRVILTKKTRHKQFVVVDAGMNDLIRPTLYGAFHAIDPVRQPAGRRQRVDVVGPVCETGDFFAQDRLLAPAAAGDLLAIRDAGAYGYTQASNYNSRRRAAEVMVQNGTFRIVRERESYEDLVRGERAWRKLERAEC
ncbi:MAG: diaminopimelate decarboxylase [Acidobacteria bacterium]|nr:diaminopimelate decarboxylase [Acidobacteriota bacterium]